MVHLLALQETNPPIHNLISMGELYDSCLYDSQPLDSFQRLFESLEASLKRHIADGVLRSHFLHAKSHFLNEILKLPKELHFSKEKKLREEFKTEREKGIHYSELRDRMTPSEISPQYTDPKGYLSIITGPNISNAKKFRFTVPKRSPLFRIEDILSTLERGLSAANNYHQMNENDRFSRLGVQLCRGTSFQTNNLICHLYGHLMGILSPADERKHFNPDETKYARPFYDDRLKHRPYEHSKCFYLSHHHPTHHQQRDASYHHQHIDHSYTHYHTTPLSNVLHHVQRRSGFSATFHCLNAQYFPHVRERLPLTAIASFGGFKPTNTFPSRTHSLSSLRQAILDYVQYLKATSQSHKFNSHSHKLNLFDGDPKIGLDFHFWSDLGLNGALRHVQNSSVVRWPHLTRHLEYLKSISLK